MSDNKSAEDIGVIKATLSILVAQSDKIEDKVDRIDGKTEHFLKSNIITESKADAAHKRIDDVDVSIDEIKKQVSELISISDRNKGSFSTLHLIFIFFIALIPFFIQLFTKT